MTLALDSAQSELREVVRRFLSAKSPEPAVRRLMETYEGYDGDVWHQLAQQLGLVGISVPEKYGGSGYGFIELAVVLEEMGRAIFGGPYFATAVLATTALIESHDDAACQDYLPGIADGSLIATLAIAESTGRWDLSAVALAATRSPGGWTLSGVKSYVLDGHVAQMILVVARAPSGISLFAIDHTAPGFFAKLTPTMDATRKLAELVFDSVPARLIGAEGDAGPAIERVLDCAAIGLAAEQVGGSQTVLDMAVDYAGMRAQFGRAIGSFQAIKHKCAEMFLGVETARSTAYYATQAAMARGSELPVAASIAKAVCSETYVTAAAENIQIHGGIGFTWEHPAHLHFRRARSSAVLFGDPHHHRELLYQRTGLAHQR